MCRLACWLDTIVYIMHVCCYAQVLTLWREPNLLPRVICRHTDVSRFLIGAAATLPVRGEYDACSAGLVCVMPSEVMPALSCSVRFAQAERT